VEENPIIEFEDHNPQTCLACRPIVSTEENLNTMTTSNSSYELFGKLSAAMKSKSAEVKEKLFDYIVNPTGSTGPAAERHVRSSDKVSKRYRNMAPVFSIDDDDAGMIFNLNWAHTKVMFVLATYYDPPIVLRNCNERAR